jgi:hypothetical protein
MWCLVLGLIMAFLLICISPSISVRIEARFDVKHL